ncbi:hypothetical protein MMC68G_00443 [Mycoplasma mycoides subsp. capri]|nr:hypothetical protein MMC68G_00443 [Mycoplasma mycoides subsp. capri]
MLNKEEGIIAFIDGDGLHITKIDGYKLINNKNSSLSSMPSEHQETNSEIKQTAVLKQIRSLYGSENASVLVPYLINSTLDSNKNSVSAMSLARTAASTTSSTSSTDNKWNWTNKDLEYATSIKHLGVDINSLNSNIKNDYERFLINTSLIDNSKTKPFYNIDILSEVSKSIQTGNNTSSQANWLIELFTKFLKNGKGKQPIDLLNIIIATDNKKNLKVTGIRKLQDANQKWVNKVKENYKKYSKDPSLDPKFIPDQVIDLNSATTDQKKRYDKLLQSDIFNSEKKAQGNTTSNLGSGSGANGGERRGDS